MRYNKTSFPGLEVDLHQDPPFYSKMENALQQLSKDHVAMENDERKRLVESAEKVVKSLLNDLRERHPNDFGKIYKGVLGVGSYYDRVRVKEATEFDFNVILDLNCLNLVIDRNNEPGGFVKVHFNLKECEKRLSSKPELLKVIKKWTNGSNGYLISQKLKCYMESISHYWRTMDLRNIDIETQPRIIKSGPAVTLILTFPNAKEVDIDLVPVIRMSKDPPKAYRWGNQFAGDWYLVPKSYRYIGGNQDESWRLSFPLQERSLLSKGRMKQVVRLLKRVRDMLNFKSICSYHIKTLFLWKSLDPNLNWERDTLSYLFFTMLTVLKQCLEHHRIQNFWCEANLLENINRATMDNWACRLKLILRRLETSIAEEKSDAMLKILSDLLGGPRSNSQ